MLKKALIVLSTCGLALCLAGCGGGDGGDAGDAGSTPADTPRAFLPLEFPFANPGDIVRVAAFGIPNWSGSEPHNGIDMEINSHLASSRIISPTAGQVDSISMGENPFSHPVGQLILTVAIKVNDEWMVDLVIEPGTADPDLKAAQRAAVLVSVGQEVTAGTPVANLLVGTLGYVHLHYMVEHNGQSVCAYTYSSDAAKATFDGLKRLRNNNLPNGNICNNQ